MLGLMLLKCYIGHGPANQTIARKIAKSLHGTDSKGLVDVLDDVVEQYNLSWHRAINQSPMYVFRGRCGYNGERIIPANEDLVEVGDDVPEEPENAPVNLDDVLGQLEESPVQLEESVVLDQTVEVSERVIENNGQIEDAPVDFDRLELLESFDECDFANTVTELEFNSDLNGTESELVEYKSRYTVKMINNADVHFNRLHFEPGEKVLIKQEHDNNTSTRKNKLSSYFEDGIWTTLERSGNSYWVEKDNEKRLVFKSLIKRYENRN